MFYCIISLREVGSTHIQYSVHFVSDKIFSDVPLNLQTKELPGLRLRQQTVLMESHGERS